MTNEELSQRFEQSKAKVKEGIRLQCSEYQIYGPYEKESPPCIGVGAKFNLIDATKNKAPLPPCNRDCTCTVHLFIETSKEQQLRKRRQVNKIVLSTFGAIMAVIIIIAIISALTGCSNTTSPSSSSPSGIVGVWHETANSMQSYPHDRFTLDFADSLDCQVSQDSNSWKASITIYRGQIYMTWNGGAKLYPYLNATGDSLLSPAYPPSSSSWAFIR